MPLDSVPQCGLRLLAANLINVSNNVFEQFYHGIMGFRWKHKIIIPSVFTNEDLIRIKTPTLLIVGDKEVIYNPKHILTEAQKLIPHIQIRLISDAGHALTIEKPEAINTEIINFLNS